MHDNRPDLISHLYLHQRAAVFDIIRELREWRSTLLAWATGTGKTQVTLGWLVEDMRPGDRAMFIVNRRQLAEQTAARIERFFPSLHPAGIVMSDQNDVASRVIVATVQSLDSGTRLNDIISYGNITHLITDECHHSVSEQYERVYARLYEANPDMRHVGATATPRRADGVALKAVFESSPKSLRLPLNKAIEMEFLVPFVVMGFYVPEVSIAHLAPAGEDWSDKGVGVIMSERAMLDCVVEKWKKYAPGSRTIAFCATVAQAHEMAQWFRDAGVTAESADHKTPKDERDAITQRFEQGQTTVLCNVGLYTEGTDYPMAETGLMLRPHLADGPYIQKAGRLLRTFLGKTSALILDFVPADAPRNMVMGGDLLDGRPRAQRKVEDRAEQLGITAFGINRQGQGIDGDPDDVLMRVLNYLIQSTLAWKKDDRIATVSLSDTRTLAVIFPDVARLAEAEKYRDTPRWNAACQRECERISKLRAFAIEQDKNLDTGKKGPKRVRSLGTFDTWDDLIPSTEDYAAEHQDASLAKRAKRWRKADPTEGQIKFARRIGIHDAGGMKRGKLAQELTHKLAMDLLARKRLT